MDIILELLLIYQLLMIISLALFTLFEFLDDRECSIKDFIFIKNGFPTKVWQILLATSILPIVLALNLFYVISIALGRILKLELGIKSKNKKILKWWENYYRDTYRWRGNSNIANKIQKIIKSEYCNTTLIAPQLELLKTLVDADNDKNIKLLYSDVRKIESTILENISLILEDIENLESKAEAQKERIGKEHAKTIQSLAELMQRDLKRMKE